MRIPRLIVQEYLQGLGLPGLVGIALLVLALVYAAAGLLPGWRSVEQLNQQTRDAGEYLAKVQAGSVAAPVVPQRELEDFRRKLPAQPQATVAIDRIYALAAQEHITLARGEYALGVDPNTHLARYQILLPVKGSYPQLRRFLHALLGELPAVVVEDVEFQRKRIADTDLTGRIRMTLYLSRS
ncbi:GspMb/PilO family protein [Pseudomonas abieticivorans]|uniref:GspMb/PilO family protein n=1 Tax=Pseudomonas abieticivorans TaxID=2931382 RepID=UPI0020BE299C|nr:GspMb/PilO family protein [Pseudomonas sp. PIA16]